MKSSGGCFTRLLSKCSLSVPRHPSFSVFRFPVQGPRLYFLLVFPNGTERNRTECKIQLPMFRTFVYIFYGIIILLLSYSMLAL